MKLKKYLILALLFFQAAKSLSQTFTIEGSGLNIDFDLLNGKHLRSLLIYPNDFESEAKLQSRTEESNLEVALHSTGNNRNAHFGAKMAGGLPGMRLVYNGIQEFDTPDGKRIVITQNDPDLKLLVESVYDFFNGTSTMRRYTTRPSRQGKSAPTTPRACIARWRG